MLWQHTSNPELGWCVTVGTLEKVEEIVKLTYQIWIEDTLDGGIARYLIEIPRYAQQEDGEILPIEWWANGVKSMLRIVIADLNHMPFNSIRPSQVRHILISTTHHPLPKLKNPDDEKWWFRPVGSKNPTHYLAG
jgi:hypothetical protein